MSTPDLSERSVTILAKELPLFCPPKNAPLWSQHPRVFLDAADEVAAVLEGGPRKGGH